MLNKKLVHDTNAYQQGDVTCNLHQSTCAVHLSKYLDESENTTWYLFVSKLCSFEVEWSGDFYIGIK